MSSSLREEKCACFFVLIVFGLCATLLSQSSVCPIISISVCLLFFSCNQTHRFISVTLKDHRNQFPSTLPRGRAAVGGHTCTCISFTHTLAETPTRAQHDTHSGANTLAGDSPHHCFLMSYLLHPYNIHLSSLTGPGSSIYPFYLYARSDSPHRYSQLRPTPTTHQTHSFFRTIPRTRMEYCACERLPYWGSAIESDIGHQSHQPLICAPCQLRHRVMNC